MAAYQMRLLSVLTISVVVTCLGVLASGDGNSELAPAKRICADESTTETMTTTLSAREKSLLLWNPLPPAKPTPKPPQSDNNIDSNPSTDPETDETTPQPEPVLCERCCDTLEPGYCAFNCCDFKYNGFYPVGVLKSIAG